MDTTHVTKNLEEIKSLLSAAPQGIKDLIKGGEVKSVTISLAQKYNVHIDKYIHLSNIITCILIGALSPESVVDSIEKDLELTTKEAVELAEDLEKGLLEKARALTIGKPEQPEVAVLEFKGEKTADALRKEIMDTTKRESGLTKPQNKEDLKKASVITPGSRSQLLEQLQILSAIPNDEEVATRLAAIQEQINSIKKEESSDTLHSNIALKSFMFGEQGIETVPAVLKTATYSVAPTRYNLDPYREVSED